MFDNACIWIKLGTKEERGKNRNLIGTSFSEKLSIRWEVINYGLNFRKILPVSSLHISVPTAMCSELSFVLPCCISRSSQGLALQSADPLSARALSVTSISLYWAMSVFKVLRTFSPACWRALLFGRLTQGDQEFMVYLGLIAWCWV